jgi:hypothetical protein
MARRGATEWLARAAISAAKALGRASVAAATDQEQPFSSHCSDNPPTLFNQLRFAADRKNPPRFNNSYHCSTTSQPTYFDSVIFQLGS